MADKVQGELALVEHDYNATPVPQRSTDGYINATAMCRAAGKDWFDYSCLKTTQAFIQALSLETGIPGLKLMQSIRGGRGGGTYVHPQVAVHLAQWLSPEFAVQVSKWVFDWLSEKRGDNKPFKLMRRAAMAARNCPRTHFSVIREMASYLHTDLEIIGYVMPDYGTNGAEIQPDISLGLCFMNWLKRNRPELVELREFYDHEFSDQRGTRQASCYPNSMRQVFFDFMAEDWVVNKFPAYIQSRDPEALPIIRQMLPELLEAPK